jgi:AAHS family 4-hydroxybenzoate transporter-like MFS transporter
VNVTTNRTDPAHDVARERARDNISVLQYWLVLLCFLVVLLDGLDTLATGFVAPSLAREFGVAHAALGPFLSMALIGMTVGALIAGPLADRVGRKPVLIGSVLMFGVCTMACAAGDSIFMLTVLRLLTGLGLGGAMPCAGTLLSEYMPASRRSFFTNLMYCGFPLGASLGGFLAAVIIPHWGWRGVFFVGGLAPLALAVGLLAMPESVRFMKARNWPAMKISRVASRFPAGIVEVEADVVASPAEKQRVGSLRMIVSRRFLPGTMLLWLAYFAGLLVFYLQTSWLPTLLQGAAFDARQSAFVVALLPFGGVLGTLACGWTLDRLSPYRVVAWTFVVGAISLFAASHSLASVAPLSAVMFASGIFLVGAQSSMLSLAMGFYPTNCRATGSAWMLGVGRAGGIVGAMAGGYLLRGGLDVRAMMSLLASIALVAAASVAICGVVTRRAADDELPG